MLYCQLELSGILGGIDITKKLPSIVTDVLKDILRAWAKDTLPKHFQTGATRKYDYCPRDVKYLRWKQKAKGGPPPLVCTGRARDIITSEGHFNVTGSKGSATGRIINVNAIRYFWMVRRKNPQLNMAAETTRLSDEEKEQIKTDLHQGVIAKLNELKGQRKIIR
jgi:hypothetical protein